MDLSKTIENTDEELLAESESFKKTLDDIKKRKERANQFLIAYYGISLVALGMFWYYKYRK